MYMYRQPILLIYRVKQSVRSTLWTLLAGESGFQGVHMTSCVTVNVYIPSVSVPVPRELRAFDSKKGEILISPWSASELSSLPLVIEH